MLRRRTRTALHVRGRGWILSLYSPHLGPERRKVELGFNLRIRDPRVPYGWRPPDHPDGRRAPVRWRWLKIYVGWTNPALADARGRMALAEVETHLTDANGRRLSYKTLLRLKAAKGNGK